MTVIFPRELPIFLSIASLLRMYVCTEIEYCFIRMLEIGNVELNVSYLFLFFLVLSQTLVKELFNAHFPISHEAVKENICLSLTWKRHRGAVSALCDITKGLFSRNVCF